MTKPGPIPHKPTEDSKQLVREFVAYGIGQEHIARKLDLSVDSLVKYYKYEIENGVAEMIHLVANKLFAKAVYQDDLGAQIFILKTRGKWREKDPEDKKSDSVIEFLMGEISELKAKKG